MSEQGSGLGKRSQQEKETAAELSIHFRLMSFDDDELEELRRMVSEKVDIHIANDEHADR